MSYNFYPLACVRFQYSRCIVLIQLFWAGFWCMFQQSLRRTLLRSGQYSAELSVSHLTVPVIQTAV